MARILNQNGFRATFVYDGVSALRAAELQPPDILLADVVMPEMDGFQTAMRVYALHPRCIIFLWSALAQECARVRELRSGGYDFRFVAKPIHPDELMRQLRGPLRERGQARTGC